MRSLVWWAFMLHKNSITMNKFIFLYYYIKYVSKLDLAKPSVFFLFLYFLYTFATHSPF